MISKHRQTGRQRVAIGNNPERNRLHNRRVVLEIIRVLGPIGRTSIARLTHLTPQAVSNIVDELVTDHLLVETGRLRTGRGQPPIQFAINPDGPMTAGVEIAADHMVTVMLDITGRVRAQTSVPLAEATPDAIAPLLVAELDKARAVIGTNPRILGIGVVMPGPFGIEGMTSVGPTTLPGWHEIDPAHLLGDATGLPVVIENDATAAAIGERFFGVGQKLADFAYIYFGAGLGMGIIHNGQPFRGVFGNAGEIGHAVVVPGGRPCACGQSGCLERYASVYALREKCAERGIEVPDFAGLETWQAEGHPVLREWIAEAAQSLAPIIATLENVLDPETMILGGALPDPVIDAVIAALAPLPVSVASRRDRQVPRVLRGTTGQFTAALGAAAIPLMETITPRLDIAPDPAGAA